MVKYSVTCNRWCFFPGSQGSSTNKTDLHDVTEILLKVALSTIIRIQTLTPLIADINILPFTMHLRHVRVYAKKNWTWWCQWSWKKPQPHSYNEEENLRASHYLKDEKVYPHHRDVCVYLYIGMIPLFRRNDVSCLIRCKFNNISGEYVYM
jgi:hypothetical protein